MSYIYWVKAVIFIFFSFFFGEMLLLVISGLTEDRIVQVVLFLALTFILIEFLLTFYKKLFSKLFFLSSVAVGIFYFLAVLFSHGEGGYSNSAAWSLAHDYVSKSEKAIKVFREKNGQCPSDLSEITGYPLDFIDPFNAKDKLLKYYILEDECVIYSVGLDRVDNKGMVKVEDEALEDDWHSSHLSYSLIAFVYKPVFDETKTIGDIVEIIK